ncbi:mannonate dehydratase [Roseobacter sp.]|uniref:mannonate dehydratase n=1 Tax=Roseobacter sp. TaxID=1907202 RepID=UPI00385D6DBC
MKQCWRWFGPQDKIDLTQLHQVGVEGIVTTLHHIPPGKTWSGAEILMRQSMLSDAGFGWDVVESLTVSEEIKTQGPDMKNHVAAF